MHSEEPVAPALSTYQDESTFSYDKVQSTYKERKHLRLKNPQDHDEVLDKIRDYYSLPQLVEKLSETTDGNQPRYRRITLQFPDELICDSATIVHFLQEKLGIDASSSQQKIWILADTSYSACCVDEIAAEHVQSDLVVHFGDACLNEVAKLNSMYVLGKPEVDVDEMARQFRERYKEGDKVVLMANAPYTYILYQLKDKLVEYKDVIVADLILPSSKSEIIGYQPTKDNKISKFNRTFPVEDISEYDLFHVTIPEAPRLLQLTTNFASVITYDPDTNTTSQGPYPNLMRRYRFVHVARSAGTIGILVNTLSLSNTKQLINTIKEKIKKAGKKHYIFVVGKPNVAKLANFESVDIWCVLGCDHQGIIIDQVNEFFKPIVTPYELLLGLSDELTWTGKWVTDYESVIEDYKQEEEISEQEVEEDNDEASSDEEPEFDPVTGRYVSMSRPLRQINHLSLKNESENVSNGDEKRLVERFSNSVAIRNTVSTSAMHLQNRQWTGLGSDYAKESAEEDEEEGALVVEGRLGIARGFILLFIENYNYPSKKQWKNLGSSDIALVTGGSSGLGLEIVKSLLMKGAAVYVLDRNPVPLKLAEESKLHYIACDLGDECELKDKLNKLIHELNNKKQYISVLVNNAGVRDHRSLINLSFDRVKAMFNINTISQVFILQKVLSNHLSYNGNGKLSIVTVSSILGTFAPKNLSIYSATKAAQIMMHESLQQELKQFPKIRLLLVTTGQMNTELFKDVKPTKQFIAPVVDHVELAQAITKKVDRGYMGCLAAPMYANFLPGIRTAPLFVQDFCRWVSEIDDKVKDIP
ncbi:DPH2 [Candida metapsilosis]|uniref:2-(3-amino-3-carboxypropyl)histidine synthase subunit 2 n=1 Tax=Candida metapsilosis TaxID=273372 RepID=A0A8H7ZG07_9ASCO|nr:DPH2 [Candida metapsilosis]